MRFRKIIISTVTKLEKGELYSKTLRKIFETYHCVKVGLYSMGGCFTPFQVDRYTTIGRYCSFARALRISNRNHSLDFRSTNSIFCISSFGYCQKDLIKHIPLSIGNDVWIGHNAIVMPNVTEIADGAVIGAGAVVNKNLPPYAVVVGNPARIVRYRFSKKVIEELLASRWWEKSLEELHPKIVSFQAPYEKQILTNEESDKKKSPSD